MLVHLADDIWISLGLLGKYDHGGIGRKLGYNIHRDTYHAEIVLQELLTG